MTPFPRYRNCGITACIIAMTPKVLVSKTSRAMASGVASKAPTTPMPAFVDEGVDGAGRQDGRGDAGGVGHVLAEPLQLSLAHRRQTFPCKPGDLQHE